MYSEQRVLPRLQAASVYRLEPDRTRNLNRVALKRRPACELLKILETDVHSPRQVHARREAERIDLVVRLGLLRSYGRATLVRRLPLEVADKPDLQARLVEESESVHQRIVQVEGLARADVRAFLSSVELIHLECRNGCPFVLCEVERLARRQGVCPIARADVVVRTGSEPARWGQKPIYSADCSALSDPTKNYRLIVRVAEPCGSADRARDV